MTDTAVEQWARDLAETLIAPLRDVGVTLAQEIDRLNDELAKLRQDVDALGRVLNSHTERLA